MKSIAACAAGVKNQSTRLSANSGQGIFSVLWALLRSGQVPAQTNPLARAQSELAEVRAQLAAMQRANLLLKQRVGVAERALAEATPTMPNTPTDIAELARLAYTDALTGVANRCALQRAAIREITRMQRSGRPACVVFIDLDHFKAVNDTFGHGVGDAMLRLIAETLTAHTRMADTVARWGGEEFVLLLPETDLAAAEVVAEKCRLAVQALASNLPRPITITLGVSEIHSSDPFEAALERADGAMYVGKKRGRNCVVLG